MSGELYSENEKNATLFEMFLYALAVEKRGILNGSSGRLLGESREFSLRKYFLYAWVIAQFLQNELQALSGHF